MAKSGGHRCKGNMSASQAEALLFKSDCVLFFGLCPSPCFAHTRRSQHASAFEWDPFGFTAKFREPKKCKSAASWRRAFSPVTRKPWVQSPAASSHSTRDFFMGFALSLPRHSTIIVRQAGALKIMPVEGGVHTWLPTQSDLKAEARCPSRRMQ
jgi:hypothetical protein